MMLRITRSHGILRRYFVVNGFDGALTMMGINMGFYAGGEAPLKIVIGACLGAAVALGMSGLTSAYISEAAERKKWLSDLEEAMVGDLSESTHSAAARIVPLLVALVNGLAPLFIGLLIIAPLWFAAIGTPLPLQPLELSILLSLFCLFLLGAFLGKVSGSFWLWSGLQTLAAAGATALIIYWVSPA
jgi:predicted membrane protein (TIGR00267 family)